MLARLNEELLKLGAEACLPTRLTDEWLATLSDSADAMLGNSTANDDSTGAACMAVIICILRAKTSAANEQIEIPLEKMHEFFVQYRMELAMEEVHRKTDIKYEPATLESILTERDVVTWREEEI